MSARRATPLLLLVGCTLAGPVARPDPVAPRAWTAPRVQQVALLWTRDGAPATAPAAWRQATTLALLEAGVAAGDPAAVGSAAPLLRLMIEREVETGVGSTLLHVFTFCLWPRQETLRLRVAAELRAGELFLGQARATAELELSTSLALLFYPPAWRSLADGKLELPAVVEALSACLRATLAELAGPAPSGTPPAGPSPAPAAGAGACPGCARGVEPGWVACPWCGAPLPSER